MGEAVQIIASTGKHSFSLDHRALMKVLLTKELKDVHVVLISVAGAFRKGKSFLLNFILRYLITNVND